MKTNKLIIALLGLVAASAGAWYLLANGYRTIADTTASIRLDAKKLGVFSLPDKTAADDLGVAWTRLPLPQWKSYLGDSDKRSVQIRLDKLKGVNVIATIRVINSDETTCHVDKAEIEKYTNRTISDEDWQKATASASCMPNDLNKYRSWVRQTVSELKGKVAVWQIENEVYSTGARFWWGDELGKFDNFITLFRATSEEIRATDSSKPIMAAGIALGQSQEFDSNGFAIKSNDTKTDLIAPIIETNVKRLLTERCTDFDISDIHLYHTIESIPNRIKWLQRLMKETNCQKPIWTTETSGPVYKDPSFKGKLTVENLPQKQAEDLPLRLKTLLDSGVERAIYFIYQDHPEGADPMLRTMGLLDATGNKKPAYTTFQQVASSSSASSVADNGSGGTGGSSSSGSETSSGGAGGFGLNFGPGTGETAVGVSGKTGSNALLKFINLGANPTPNFPTRPAAIVALIYRVVLLAGASIFLVMFLVSGARYLLGSGNEEAIAKAKQTVITSLIGLLIVLSAWALGIAILHLIGYS